MTLDLPRFRRALAQADLTIPRIVDPRTIPSGEVDELERAIKEMEMTESRHTTSIGLRLTHGLIERIDRFARAMETEMVGLRLQRTEAIRMLVGRSLDAWEPKQQATRAAAIEEIGWEPPDATSAREMTVGQLPMRDKEARLLREAEAEAAKPKKELRPAKRKLTPKRKA